MKESFLIKVCITGSIAGLVSLYFISFMIVPEEIGPGELSPEFLGRKVRLSGTVQELRTHPSGHVFFELADETGSADVVIWEDKAEQLLLSGVNVSKIENGVGMEVTGSVEYYKGNLQVVI